MEKRVSEEKESKDHFRVKRSARRDVLKKVAANASASHEKHRNLLHPSSLLLLLPRFRLFFSVADIVAATPAFRFSV